MTRRKDALHYDIRGVVFGLGAALIIGLLTYAAAVLLTTIVHGGLS